MTSELKSTSRSLIWPDTCVPTDTCVTGFTAPLADTVACKLPRSILPVRYCTSATTVRCCHHQAPAPNAASTTTPTSQFFFFMACILGILALLGQQVL